MKFNIYIFVAILFTVIGNAQNESVNVDSLLEQETIIWKELMNEKITSKQWLQQKLALGYYQEHLQAWYKYDEPVDILNHDYNDLLDSNAIHLKIPENYQKQRPNGSKYLKLYLINMTDSILTIPRIDATINKFSTEIFLDDKWIPFQNTKGSSCGNSYWKDQLNPKNLIEVSLNYSTLGIGDQPFEIRVVYEHFGEKIISNAVKTQLNENQVARIRNQPD